MFTHTIFDSATEVATNNDFDLEVYIHRFYDTLGSLSDLGTFSSEIIDGYFELMAEVEKDGSFESSVDIVLLTWQLDYVLQCVCISPHFGNRLSKLSADLSGGRSSFVAGPL